MLPSGKYEDFTVVLISASSSSSLSISAGDMSPSNLLTLCACAQMDLHAPSALCVEDILMIVDGGDGLGRLNVEDGRVLLRLCVLRILLLVCFVDHVC